MPCRNVHSLVHTDDNYPRNPRRKRTLPTFRRDLREPAGDNAGITVARPWNHGLMKLRFND